MTVVIDGREVAVNGERNLLEVIRKANIDLPTFCYHSELSVYGACRLCLVEVEGRGLMASCSTQPEAGMRVRTSTEEIRQIRRLTVELLLANHDESCPTCPKSGTCKLQDLARRLGLEEVRFRPTLRKSALDRSSPSLVRDPNRCVLCGDCVRVCDEVQGVGAIDFIHRGSHAAVGPAFGKELSGVECVLCGQCARVCPTGAITPAQEIPAVWRDLEDPSKTVVAQIAPAVRVALGEAFGLEPGTGLAGQIAAALRVLGFSKVYDTSFAADLTVLEEGAEFVRRATEGGSLPQFTSCCPAWVKFAEQYYPDLLPNLSSCRSPQQMFGSLAKAMLPDLLGVRPEDLVVVSIMPCTAKKFEAKREEFSTGGMPHVDHVLTTQELARMMEQMGIRLTEMAPESFDMPMGFKTGAGVIFGASGGVTEAVLRYAAEKLGGAAVEEVAFPEVRGDAGLREATVNVGGRKLRLAIAHGLRQARQIAESVRAGRCEYDLVEVMACPGGCVGGAGQPIAGDFDAVRQRAHGLYETDRGLQFRKSQDNPQLAACYKAALGEVGGEKAHCLLHTHYQSRKRIADEDITLIAGPGAEKVRVRVCVGTGCYLRGSQDLLHGLIRRIREMGLDDRVDVQATFCFEQCDRGPSVAVGDQVLERCSLETVQEALVSRVT